MRRIIFLLIFLPLAFSGYNASAQTRFQRVYGGVDSTDDGLDVKQTTDGGYIINSRITTFKSNASCEEAYLIKTDASGTLQWSKRHEGPNCEEGRSIIQTSDGGYFYAGESKSWGFGGPNDFDVFATKTDASGNIQWTRNIGDVWNDGAWAVGQNTDGSYMAFGMSANMATNGYYDYYLAKLDIVGNVIWTKTYGGTYIDYGYDAVQTADGGYIMAGSSYPSQTGGGGTHFYIVKADVNGTFQWGRLVNGFADDFARSVIQTNDGGYLGVGGTQSFGSGNTDVFMVKTASDGTVSWTKTFGGLQHDCGFTVKQTSDGGYAVCGGTNSVGNGGYDLFLLKTNSSGNLLWTKTYGGSLDDGPSGGMFFLFSNTDRDVSMVITSDGGFAITSLTNSFPGGNVYLVKTDSNGNSGCNETNGPFLETVPSPSVAVGGSQTNPVQQVFVPVPLQLNPATSDTNVCCVTPTAAAGADVTICSGGNSTLTASGGTNYSWSTGATTSSVNVSPTSTTSYIVTVSDSCGSDKDTVVVTVNALPTSNAGSDVTVCPGATVTLTGTGSGTSYLWSPGGQTTTSVSVSPTATTTYTFSSTNSCGTANDNVTITVSNFISASVSGNTTICPGGSATLSASGGSTYSWTTGSTASSISVTPSVTTTYSVIASSGSCADTASATVTVSNSINATITGNTQLCPGATATLTASGGNVYSWSTGSSSSSITVTPGTPGTYTYYVIVSSGSCSDTATVNVVSAIPITTNLPGYAVCQPGDSVALLYTISGGTAPYSYQWSTGSTASVITVAPSVTTSYTLSITDANGCSDVIAINVPVINYFVSASGTSLICPGDAVTLTATVSNSSGSNLYLWNTGATTTFLVVSPTVTTTYTVITQDVVFLCMDAAAFTVTVVPSPTAAVTGDDTICVGGSTSLIASGGGNYLWNTGQSTASISVSPSATSNYSVVVSAGSCMDTANYSVAVVPNPVANAGTSMSISQGQSATLTASGGGTYSWTSGMTGPAITVSPAVTTQYCVIVTDVNGCSDSSCVIVYVKPMDCPENVYVPNAFSPNDDTENDLFRVFFVNPDCVKEFKLVLYDRWGEKMMTATDPAFTWDGIYRSAPLSTAVFVYHLYVLFDSGTELNLKGNVSLVR